MQWTQEQVERLMADSFARGYEMGLSQAEGSATSYVTALQERSGMKAKKRKQSGKQKILTQMAKKAWNKYKKGNGKKSYIDIRAQVSRSQAYKKKTKGM